ncbi:MAG: response regulator, partial [Bdellovibrionales bacterium]|nr:response regulator [Bdellovibrionales bacterium]
MRVLIVDDEPLVRRALKRVAEMRGHEVVEAENGSQGLEKWKQENPQLVFLDVLMPGLSG